MKVFLDTNVVVYAQQDGSKGDAARLLIAEGGTISVQVLNELTNVLSRKFRRGWQDIEAVLSDVHKTLGEAVAITAATHAAAFELARHHGLAFYDALVVASALEQGCATLYSENLQDGRVFGSLTIRNPFARL